MGIRVAILAFILCAGLMKADELVFVGHPMVRFDADGTVNKEHDMSKEGEQKYECRIVSKGKRFYWASRNNRELIRSEAGDYTYYISPEGTGYVKIYTGKQNAGVKMPYDYMEQLTSELKTFTYWGKRTN